MNKQEETKTINIYFSEYDIGEMQSAILKGETLYDTWMPNFEGSDERIKVQIYLGEEEEDINQLKLEQ